MCVVCVSQEHLAPLCQLELMDVLEGLDVLDGRGLLGAVFLGRDERAEQRLLVEEHA